MLVEIHPLVHYCRIMAVILLRPCLVSLSMPQMPNGFQQVFEDFTVFASDYAAFIHGCDRCRMLRWMWVECNVGILDQDLRAWQWFYRST